MDNLPSVVKLSLVAYLEMTTIKSCELYRMLVFLGNPTRLLSVWVDIDRQLHSTQNHHESTPLGLSVREFLDCAN